MDNGYRQKKNLNGRLSIGYICVVVVLILFALSCILPVLNVFAQAFNDTLDSRKGGFMLFPRKPSLGNFREIFAKYPIGRAYLITIYRTVCGIFLEVMVNSMFAYSLTKPDLIGKKFINWYMIIPMYFGAGIIPFYLILKMLNISNTLWVYLLPYAASPFYIIVFRTFFKGVPLAIEESAKLDGAGYFRIFFRIILPLSKPVLATVALFVGVGHWNDWYVGSMYVFSDKLWPMQTWLRYILAIANSKEIASMMDSAMLIATGTTNVAADSIKMAMIVLTITPILCIYPFMQRYFIAGVAVGSLKE